MESWPHGCGGSGFQLRQLGQPDLRSDCWWWRKKKEVVLFKPCVVGSDNSALLMVTKPLLVTVIRSQPKKAESMSSKREPLLYNMKAITIKI